MKSFAAKYDGHYYAHKLCQHITVYSKLDPGEHQIIEVKCKVCGKLRWESSEMRMAR